MHDIWDDMGFKGVNYKGRSVINCGGLIIVIFVTFIYFLYYSHPVYAEYQWPRMIFLLLLTAGAGLVDDILGGKESKGFKGHFTNLVRGEFTTGFFKALTITFAAFLAVPQRGGQLLINVGIIVLTTNLLNLLDLRPGRTIKFFLFVSLSLLVINIDYNILYFLPFYLIFVFYLPRELNQSVMLGDVGSNSLGVILGWNLIYINSLIYRVIILLLLLTANLLSEKYSFNHYIINNKYLNWLDQLGR